MCRRTPNLILMATLAVALCSGCGGSLDFNPETGDTDTETSTASDLDADADTDADTDTDTDSETDTGTDGGCPEGFQDNDEDGECLPDCGTVGLQCPANSHCDDHSGHVECVCDNDFQDNDDNGSCHPACGTSGTECEEHEQCDDSGGEATCVCEGGFQDNDLDETCEPGCGIVSFSCGDNGECDDSGGTAECVCDPEYSGDLCDFCAFGYQDNDGDGECRQDCGMAVLSCAYHAHCDDNSGIAQCVCNLGYDGAGCDECAPGYQDNDANGTCLEDCVTATPTCDGAGSCQDDEGFAVCVCDDGYQDNDLDGTCLPTCDTAAPDCETGEICVDWEGQAVCECPRGYQDDGCSECADGFEWEVGQCVPSIAWTFAVYLNADNDLQSYGYQDLAEMEAVGSTDDVEVVVMFDTFDGGTSILEVSAGGSAVVVDCGEEDMGDWRTLRDFGVWVSKNRPARRVALVLWDHGEGWSKGGALSGGGYKSFSSDDHGSAAGISVARGGLGTALEQIVAAAGGTPLDVLGFDACLMGMWEVGMVAAPNAGYLVASSEVEPTSGWPYDEILAGLAADPSMEPGPLATSIVQHYHDESIQHFTLSSVDLGEHGQLTEAISYLASQLIASPGYYDELEAIRLSCQRYDNPDHVDLVDLAGGLSSDPAAPAGVASAAGDVLLAASEAVSLSLAQTSRPGANGFAIYLPSSGTRAEAEYLDYRAPWVDESTWDDLVRAFAPVGLP